MSGLNVRQDKFAREYVKDGNGTRAARTAGYTGNDNVLAVTASKDLLRNPKVAAEIKALRNRLAERLDISRDKLLNNAAHMAEQAHAKGEYGPAIKATELVMKAQGYLVERSLSLSVDVTQQHLDALQQYTDARIKDALAPFVTDVTDEHTQHNVSDRSMDVMEHPTHDDATDANAAANPLTDKDNQPQEAEDIEAPRMR